MIISCNSCIQLSSEDRFIDYLNEPTMSYYVYVLLNPIKSLDLIESCVWGRLVGGWTQ